MTDEFVPRFFNIQLAEMYGVNAALLFHHIKLRTDKVPGHFVRLTLDDFADIHPYLGAWEIRAALRVLTHPSRRYPAIVNRNGSAGSYSYSLACAAPSAKAHSFDIRVANQVGVTAAIIHANITYWIEDNWKRAAGDVMEKLNLADFDSAHAMEAFAFAHTEPKAACHRRVQNWADEHTYLKPRTVERAFATLIAEGLLVCKPKHRIPVWYFSENDRSDFLASALDDKELTVAIRQNTAQFSAKITTPPPKSQLHRQNHNLSAKSTGKHDLSDSSEETSAATKKLCIEALALRAPLRVKLNRKTTSRSVASRADALPAGTATAVRLRTKVYRKQLSKLPPATRKAIQPHSKVKTPWVEPVVRKDEFGNTVKRQYIRRALPAKLDLEDYFDLTTEQRKAYDAQELLRSGS